MAWCEPMSFGRRVLLRLGTGALNWEDDADIIDEMFQAELERRAAAEGETE